MPNFLFARVAVSLTHSKRSPLGFLHHHPYPFLVFNSLTSAAFSQLNEQNQQLEQENDSFTVLYLMGSCGLSPKVANAISKRVQLKDPGRADLVLNLLGSYGFSKTQISNLVTKHPKVLLTKPKVTLLPKLRFFQSIGFSTTDLPELLSCRPLLMCRSLKFIILRYKVLKSVLKDDEKVAETIKRSVFSLCRSDSMKNLVSNTMVLRELGVPSSSVSRLVIKWPEVAFLKHAKFVACVMSAKDVGIDPSKSLFIMAVQTLAYLKKSTLESKIRLYESLGWTREVTLSTFKKYPYCLIYSEEKIKKSMTYLVEEMGWSPEDIARNSAVLSFSLKQRIIPRCSVFKILKANGLVKNDLSISSLMFPCEEKFLERFVVRFQKNIPRLLEVYKEQIDPLLAGQG